MSIGSYWGNAVLDYITNRNTWVSLHTSDPGVTGELSTEHTGGSYERDQVSASEWNAAASRQINTDNVIEWNNLDAGIITHIGVWDSSTGGNIIASGPLASPVTLEDSDRFTITGGNLTLSLVAS